MPRGHVLTPAEIARLTRVLAGVTGLRPTGGEPLLRPDPSEIVQDAASTPGIREVSMTTNAVPLADRLDEMVQAGVHRVNVSVNSLDPVRFQAMTRRRDLDRVLEGRDVCERHPGLGTIKVNAVLLRGHGEDDVIPLATSARRRPFVIRFIEAMPLDADRRWRRDAVVPGTEARALIAARWPLESLPREWPSAPATRWRYGDGRGAVRVLRDRALLFGP